MPFRIRKLSAHDPADNFPDPATAETVLGYPDGLVAIGGDLSPARLLAAYHRGIFPWFNDDQPILWWSPDPRAVIFPAEFHMSRSLARELRNEDWSYTLNQNFAAVIEHCAQERDEHGTWITAEMIDAYCALHELGYAHSIESWHEGNLAGGIYGIRLGGVFFGESMFSVQTNGSKVAISALIDVCKKQSIAVLDCQLSSAHLGTLGMCEVSRGDFLEQLPALTKTAKPWREATISPLSAQSLANLRNTAK